MFILLDFYFQLLFLNLLCIHFFIMPFYLIFKLIYLHLQHFFFFFDELHLHYFLLRLRPSCTYFILKLHHLLIKFLFFFIISFKFLLKFIPLLFQLMCFLFIMFEVPNFGLQFFTFYLQSIIAAVRYGFFIRFSLIDDCRHLIEIGHKFFVFLLFHFELGINRVVFHLLF